MTIYHFAEAKLLASISTLVAERVVELSQPAWAGYELVNCVYALLLVAYIGLRTLFMQHRYLLHRALHRA